MFGAAGELDGGNPVGGRKGGREVVEESGRARIFHGALGIYEGTDLEA